MQTAEAAIAHDQHLVAGAGIAGRAHSPARRASAPHGPCRPARPPRNPHPSPDPAAQTSTRHRPPPATAPASRDARPCSSWPSAVRAPRRCACCRPCAAAHRWWRQWPSGDARNRRTPRCRATSPRSSMRRFTPLNSASAAMDCDTGTPAWRAAPMAASAFSALCAPNRSQRTVPTGRPPRAPRTWKSRRLRADPATR